MKRSAVLLALLWASPAVAQDPMPLPTLSDSIAERIVRMHNAPGTTRISGDATIARGTVIGGDLVAFDGQVIVAGRIEGSLAVVNGDLAFEPDASVGGDVLIIGGQVVGVGLATIGGAVETYPDPFRYRRNSDGSIMRAPESIDALAAGRDFPFGRADLLLASRTGYNRAEGLPIQLGPRFRFGSRRPTYLDGVVIFRTATDLDELAVDRLGYAVRAEQTLGDRNALRLGGRIYSEILPIERDGLSDRENSLATFVLHEDYRDSYEVTGWSAYLRYTRAGGATDFTVEYADERHHAVAPADPWTILHGDDPWRPNPVVAEGELRTLRAGMVHDTRNEEADPSAGWWIRMGFEQGVGGDLSVPPDVTLPEGEPLFDRQERDDFTFASLDLRRYARLSPFSRVALRIFATGSLNGVELPSQRQRTLGGVGNLPAYDLFQFDCGARESRIELRGHDFFPYYGCDRVFLVQGEYQAGFPFIRRLGDRLGLGIDLGQEVRWVGFFDAGQAWTERKSLGGRETGATGIAADVGLGIRIGAIGLYWALPVGEGGSGINFFVRLGRRL